MFDFPKQVLIFRFNHHVYVQWHPLLATFFPSFRNPISEGISYLDLCTIEHLVVIAIAVNSHNSHNTKESKPSWASVYILVHFCSHWHRHVRIHTAYCTSCLSSQTPRDCTPLLPGSDVLHPHLLFHGVSHPLAMAFHCFMTICNPLHYTVVLTQSCITQRGSAAVAPGVALMAPLPILLKQLPFCKNIIICHLSASTLMWWSQLWVCSYEHHLRAGLGSLLL